MSNVTDLIVAVISPMFCLELGFVWVCVLVVVVVVVEVVVGAVVVLLYLVRLNVAREPFGQKVLFLLPLVDGLDELAVRLVDRINVFFRVIVNVQSGICWCLL